jgi:hypothetical protein
MSDLIKFYQSDMMNALYYFDMHGPSKKKLSGIPQDKRVKKLYRLIRKIKFPSLKRLLRLVKYITVAHDLDTPKKITQYVCENAPRTKYGERWIEQRNKMKDILTEILNLFNNEIMTKGWKREYIKNAKKIQKKYSKYWPKFKEATKELPGMRWKRKEPIICLLVPIDGRLSWKANQGDVAYVEASEKMVENEALFFHEVTKLINFTKPIGYWVKRDKEGVRGIAYELFSEMQNLYLTQQLFNRKPNFKQTIYEKLNNIWIPFISPGTVFDEDELERVLEKAYKLIPNKEFEAMFQMGEIYTDLNIIRLA